MNVGFLVRGQFKKRAENALLIYGVYMRVNSRSLYDCTMAEPEFIAVTGTKLTAEL